MSAVFVIALVIISRCQERRATEEATDVPSCKFGMLRRFGLFRRIVCTLCVRILIDWI